MIIRKDISDLYEFEAWSGACYAANKIVAAGLGEEFINELESLYPEGMEDGSLNDLLWFEPDWCFALVGLNSNGELIDDDEDEDEEDSDDEDEEDSEDEQ